MSIYSDFFLSNSSLSSQTAVVRCCSCLFSDSYPHSVMRRVYRQRDQSLAAPHGAFLKRCTSSGPHPTPSHPLPRLGKTGFALVDEHLSHQRNLSRIFLSDLCPSLSLPLSLSIAFSLAKHSCKIQHMPLRITSQNHKQADMECINGGKCIQIYGKSKVHRRWIQTLAEY